MSITAVTTTVTWPNRMLNPQTPQEKCAYQLDVFYLREQLLLAENEEEVGHARAFGKLDEAQQKTLFTYLESCWFMDEMVYQDGEEKPGYIFNLANHNDYAYATIHEAVGLCADALVALSGDSFNQLSEAEKIEKIREEILRADLD